MNRPLRLAAALLAAATLAPFPAPARAQDKPAPAADAAKGKEAKVRELLRIMRWDDQVLLGLNESFDMQVRMGTIPEAFPKKFREVADFKALEDLTVGEWTAAFDEKTIDAAIAFYGSPEGAKFSEGTLVVTKAMMRKIEPWAIENAMKAMAALMGEDEGEEPPPPSVSEKAIAAEGATGANESRAIRTLWNMASCQAQIQTSGKIDADEDGIGEYATLLEMTGSVGVRKKLPGGKDDDPWRASSGFLSQGTRVDPPILAPSLANVDGEGIVRKDGYCFRIFLPDDAAPSGFTHEAGPAKSVAMKGGTARVAVDMSEVTWCAYAWPEKRGETGNRVFFVSHAGDVLASSNEKARWEGAKAPGGNAAYRGAGCTSRFAVGTRGQDGDLWKIVN